MSEGTLATPVSESDHTLGPADAPVTLVEYGDYECSYCGQAYPIVNDVLRQRPDKVRFVFRNFPLTQVHPRAQAAAEAAEAAGAQGSFWPMHDHLYEHQDALDDASLVAAAKELGLDVERFKQDLTNQTYAERVRADFMSGVRSGVNGTPTFFINGRRHDDSWDEQTLLAAIDAAASK
jgi:protein-disulfide isomerase